MGATVRIEDHGSGQAVAVEPGPDLEPLSGVIPGDISSAAYWLAAACVCSDSEISLRRVGLNPDRRAIVDLLKAWGAEIDVSGAGEWMGEPHGDLWVKGTGGGLRGGLISAERVPGLIDELPLLAALGPFTERGVEIRGAAELRVKESDRIAAISAALRALGAEVDEFPDGLAVAGDQALRGGSVHSHGDHRIALAVGAVAVAAQGPVTIAGAEAMEVSYPDFDATLESLSAR
jgi:3-phosphoshikimate 1-carboxyvinyltransferase